MNEFWQVAIGIAGLGAVATFAVWSLYREWLRLPIFQTLTKKQQFSLLRMFLILTFLFGISGLAAYVYIQTTTPTDPSLMPVTMDVSRKIYIKPENGNAALDNLETAALIGAKLTYLNPNEEPYSVINEKVSVSIGGNEYFFVPVIVDQADSLIYVCDEVHLAAPIGCRGSDPEEMRFLKKEDESSNLVFFKAGEITWERFKEEVAGLEEFGIQMIFSATVQNLSDEDSQKTLVVECNLEGLEVEELIDELELNQSRNGFFYFCAQEV